MRGSKSKFDTQRFTLMEVQNMPSNVVVGVTNDWIARNPNETIHNHINVEKFASFIRTVARDNPTWHLEGSYCYWGNLNIDEFKVFVRDEYIGRLFYNWHKDMYCVSSSQIAESMERKGYKETKDLAKAMKLVNTLTPRSLGDHFRAASHDIKSGKDRMVKQAFTNTRDKFNALKSTFADFALNNFELLLKTYESNNTVISMLKELKVSSIESEMMSKIQKAKGVCVYIHDDVYIVEKHKEDAGIERHTVYPNSDLLPDDMRRKIGMLKLVQDDAVITDVGYRFASNKFFVITENT